MPSGLELLFPYIAAPVHIVHGLTFGHKFRTCVDLTFWSA